MITNKTSLKVAVYLDGRPGHEKQTLGILQQLEKRRAVEKREFQVTRQPIGTQLLRFSKYLLSLRGHNKEKQPEFDLIIGTGTHTHVPMLLVKKEYGIPVITCMTPASYLTAEFDLIFAPVHDNPPERHNIFRTIGPPNICENQGLHNTEQVLILVGGKDSKSHIWDEDMILQAVADLINQKPEKHFTLSSSPRTPEETEKGLVRLAGQRDNTECFLFAETPRGWVEQQYSSSGEVWVTGDSVSMVYEALSSGCNVGIIPVKWKNRQSKFIDSLTILEKQGLIVTLDNYLSGYQEWTKGSHLNEAARCADEILRRWG